MAGWLGHAELGLYRDLDFNSERLEVAGFRAEDDGR